MKLYDFLKIFGEDFDTYDDVYDTDVTVCINLEPEDDYDEFCVALTKKINVERLAPDGNPVCDWWNYIKRNLPIFRQFANDNWIKNNYPDEEDFICEWIEELHRFLAGYGADNQYWFYKQEFVDKCK